MRYTLILLFFSCAAWGQKINLKALQKNHWEIYNGYSYHNAEAILKLDTLKLYRIISFPLGAVIHYPDFYFHNNNQFELHYDVPFSDTASTLNRVEKGEWEFNKKRKQFYLQLKHTYLYDVLKTSDSLIVLIRQKF